MSTKRGVKTSGIGDLTVTGNNGLAETAYGRRQNHLPGVPDLQHDISHIALALRGLPVARAFRSAGSMIHFDFGTLHERTHGRIVTRHGDYGMMIEAADWTIERQGALVVTGDAWTRRIDDVMRGLRGIRLRRVCFAGQSVSLHFDKGFVLSVFPSVAGRRYRRLDNWVIFRGQKTSDQEHWQAHHGPQVPPAAVPLLSHLHLKRVL